LDVCLSDKDGNLVEMGSMIDQMDETSNPYFYAYIKNEEAIIWKSRRNLLREIMSKFGFAQHPNEWWHFSFGDQLWAWINKKANDKGFSFLDAPISGGQAGAEGGILSVLVGGDEEVFKKAEPVIDCYSKKVKLIGPCGSGQLTKMMNQMCIAGTVQGLSEAINFGINAGLDMDKVMETISKGAAQSWQMENRYRTMTDDKFDYGFAIDWMRKDLKIAIEEAKKNGSPVPITEIIDGYYAEVQEMGGNRWDSSGLIARLKKKK